MPENVYLKSNRTGLAVMRLQPPHRGHMNLIGRMLQDCDTVIVALGSAQVWSVPRHPFTAAQRAEMLHTIFGDLIVTLPLVDMPEASNEAWTAHVLKNCADAGLPEPTDIYSGSRQDATYYTGYFASFDDPVTEQPMTKSYHGRRNGEKTGRHLHILDRIASGLPPAEDLRKLIERHDPSWRAFVPARIADYVEAYYPPDMRMEKPDS